MVNSQERDSLFSKTLITASLLLFVGIGTHCFAQEKEKRKGKAYKSVNRLDNRIKVKKSRKPTEEEIRLSSQNLAEQERQIRSKEKSLTSKTKNGTIKKKNGRKGIRIKSKAIAKKKNLPGSQSLVAKERLVKKKEKTDAHFEGANRIDVIEAKGKNLDKKNSEFTNLPDSKSLIVQERLNRKKEKANAHFEGANRIDIIAAKGKNLDKKNSNFTNLPGSKSLVAQERMIRQKEKERADYHGANNLNIIEGKERALDKKTANYTGENDNYFDIEKKVRQQEKKLASFNGTIDKRVQTEQEQTVRENEKERARFKGTMVVNTKKQANFDEFYKAHKENKDTFARQQRIRKRLLRKFSKKKDLSEPKLGKKETPKYDSKEKGIWYD
ncbi:MAG: hypothetical protein AB8B61_09085 [Cyclobacteriaceae bacterium]